MKKLYSFYIAVVSLLIFGSAHAQQLGLQTLYNQNLYMINPAAAGKDDCISAYLNHRNQWFGVKESPRVNSIFFDNRFGEYHAVGLDVRNFRSGLISNLNVKATYAYHVKMSENSTLSAGISLGFIQQRFRNLDAIASDYTDNLLTQSRQSDGGFTSDLGLIYHWDKLIVGIAVPQIFATGLLVDYGSTTADFKLVDHMNFYASYEVLEIDEWKASASILYKNSDFAAHQIEIGANALWKDMFEFGLMYRSTFGVSGMVGVKFLEQYRFGYSYEIGAGNITGISKGAHEIMLGIRVCD